MRLCGSYHQLLYLCVSNVGKYSNSVRAAAYGAETHPIWPIGEIHVFTFLPASMFCAHTLARYHRELSTAPSRLSAKAPRSTLWG